MEGNIYELLYMIRMKNAEALEELFLLHRKSIETEIAIQLAKNRSIASFRDDLLIEAQVGLVKAVEYFRNDQGCSFSSFANLIIRRRLSQEAKRCRMNLSENGNPILSLDYEMDENHQYSNLIPAADRMGDPVYRFRFNEAARRMKKTESAMNDAEKQVLQAWKEGGTYAMYSEKFGITCRQYERRLTNVKKKMVAAIKDEPVPKSMRKTSPAKL